MMKKLLAIIFLSPLVLSENINIKEVQTNNLDSVMFVGNSFFYYNNSLHNHLRKIISGDSSVETINTRSITINGSSLSWHSVEAYLDNKNIGGFRIDSKNDNKYIESKDTSIDAVIFMDCSLCPIHPKTKDNFHKYVAKHSETIRARGAEPMLFMSWPYKNKKDMINHIERFNDHNVHFLVFGRKVNNKFISLKDIAIPDNIRQRCTGFDEASFRDDISSTELRLED